MWLLDTATAELHYFNSPEDVPLPGYAILSHVWRKDEQSFQDVKAIIERCKQLGKNPRDFVSEKIRRCCEIAEGEGYKWVWNDTCCIDKMSSAELSEAINSMYRYYTLSVVCFVFLDDVEEAYHFLAPSWYDRCSWTMRGWTLQELIAPTVVIFLSQTWTPIGSKHDLADRLEKLSKIPASILKHETHLSDYSVAQRMSWAARRQTTRMEDEAYCLLGIFDITMPTLYGEGRRAFQRLQEEIMRTRLDTTLFAWGSGRRIMPPLTTALEEHTTRFPLLARAPSDFEGCSGVVYSPASDRPEASMSFQITPHGILARVPLLEFEEKTFINLSCTDRGHTAMLLCVEQSAKGGIYSVVGPDPTSRVFANTSNNPVPCGEMTNIYLGNNTSGPASSTTKRPIIFPCNGSPRAPFHFSFTLDGAERETVAAQDMVDSWEGTPPAVIKIRPVRSDILLIYGICTSQTHQAGSLPEPSSYIHWARVQWSRRHPDSSGHPLDQHDCTKHHIADWTGGQNVFRSRYNTPTSVQEVTLSFVDSKMYPNTLILRSVTCQLHARWAGPTLSRDFDAEDGGASYMLVASETEPLSTEA